jgi:hypothetical protein
VATNQSDVEIGKIVGGSEDQFGITLHVVKTIEGDLCEIGFDFYSPEDPLFSWALEQFEQLQALQYEDTGGLNGMV